MTERTNRRLAAALLVLAAGLVAVGLLGPLTSGPVEYHVSETLRNQLIGLDAASVFVVSPLAVFAAALTARGQAAGPALALPIGAYTAYMFVQYIVGPEYAARPGDNEVLFPLYLVLFTLGWSSALAAWHALDTSAAPVSTQRDRVLGRFVLPALAFLAFSRYAPALADVMGGDPQDDGYLAGPTFFWVIAMLDLGVFLPATIVTCVGLRRRRAWATKALYLVSGWFGLVGPAVAGMAIAMQVNGDPNGSAADAALMSVLGLAFAALMLAAYWPLIRQGRRVTPADGGDARAL
jgi:hypothetical protein